jgi:hypothetical protein
MGKSDNIDILVNIRNKAEDAYEARLIIDMPPIQHYVIKFVSDLRQVSGFLQVFRFPPPIKLTATI